MKIELNESNSWTCQIHKDLKCRIYPKTEEALNKHYNSVSMVTQCIHEQSVKTCKACSMIRRKIAKEYNSLDMKGELNV